MWPSAGGSALSQVVLAASQRAAGVDNRSAAKLPSWKVKKVAIEAPARGGLIAINSAQFSPRAGRTLAEQAMHSYGLFNRRFQLGHTRSFQIFVLDLPQAIGRKDLFSGIAFQPGTPGRRSTAPGGQQVDDLVRVHRRQNTIRTLLDRSVGGDFDPRLLAQLQDLTEGLTPSTGGDVLFSLASRSYLAGNSNAALELHQYFVSRFPDHDLTDPSQLWLFHFLSSEEVAWRQSKRRTDEEVVVQAGGGKLPAKVPLGGEGIQIAPVMAVELRTHPDNQQPSTTWDAAAKRLQLLETARPTLHFDPLVRFPTTAIERRQGKSIAVEKSYRALATNNSAPIGGGMPMANSG